MLSNLKHATRNGEHVTIGGGRFSPSEIATFITDVAHLHAELAALVKLFDKLHPNATNVELNNAREILSRIKP